MSVARTTEITAASNESYEDAIKVGLKRAAKTLEGIESAWVDSHTVQVGGNGKIKEHRVRLKVTFILKS